MNRKLIFVGLLLGLFIFPLFLNIHKVNADDKAPVMLDEGCTSGTDTQRITCYTNNDLAYRERIFELEVYLAESRAGTDGDACQEQQQGITDISALLQTCRGDQGPARGSGAVHGSGDPYFRP